MPRKLLFENRSCPRCGGSGNYSWCQSYGSTCFQCHGDGVVLTKRGQAAQRWLNEARKKPGSEIEVGMTILIEGVPGFSASKWAKVVEVSDGGNRIEAEFIKGGERTGMNGFSTMMIRVAQTKERLAELKAEALALQANLTKTGTVRKRKAKEATPA